MVFARHLLMSRTQRSIKSIAEVLSFFWKLARNSGFVQGTHSSTETKLTWDIFINGHVSSSIIYLKAMTYTEFQTAIEHVETLNRMQHHTVFQGSATYGTRATHGTPSNFQWHAEPSQVAQNVFIIHTEVAPIGATRSIKNSPVVPIEFVHNISYCKNFEKKGRSPKKKKGQHLCYCRYVCIFGPMNDTKPAANQEMTFFFFLETTPLGVPILCLQ